MKYPNPIRSLLIAVPLLLGIASASPMASEGASDISVNNPYARAVPQGQPNSAVFMTLNNAGTADQSIVGAESDAANVVELHTHIDEGGMMKMRQIEKIDIPSQSETVLKPGGLHVMLIDLQRDLNPGESVNVTLIFADGSRKQVEAPVKKLQMKMKKHMMH